MTFYSINWCISQLAKVIILRYYLGMRNNEWLNQKLDYIWQTFFANVPRSNEVNITFGRCARTRLGSIKQIKYCSSRKRELLNFSADKPASKNIPPSQIIITGYFKNEQVPEFMIEAVVAHELCHYAHGFSSPLPQLFKYPHQGRAVDREMIKRGLGDILLAQNKWLKTEWKAVIGPVKRRRRVRKVRRTSLFQFLFSNN